MMDTLFAVEVEVGDQKLSYGPYLDFSNAAEIMMDCLPMLIQIDLPKCIGRPYISSIVEYAFSDSGWELIAVKAQEHRS